MSYHNQYKFDQTVYNKLKKEWDSQYFMNENPKSYINPLYCAPDTPALPNAFCGNYLNMKSDYPFAECNSCAPNSLGVINAVQPTLVKVLEVQHKTDIHPLLKQQLVQKVLNADNALENNTSGMSSGMSCNIM
jgi:hypothetical protein